MRKIKFRGLRHLDNGKTEWVYGFYVERWNNKRCICQYNPKEIPGKPNEFEDNWDIFVDVYEDTIGQFTGLTDKNGTEIYEGDILRIDCHPWLDWKELESVNAEVLFENFAIIAQWKNPDAGKLYGFPDDEYVESEYVAEILCNLPNTIEVIGNILDNPIEE